MIWNYFWTPIYFQPFLQIEGLQQPYHTPRSYQRTQIPPPQFTQNKKEKLKEIFRNGLKRILQQKHNRPEKKTWTAKEDDLLVMLREKQFSWEEISLKIDGSCPSSCERRYKRFIRLQQKWPTDLDELIKNLVQVQKLDWLPLAQKVRNYSTKFMGYTPKMIRQRYKNYLRPGLERRPWLYEDDVQLLQLIDLHNCQWERIIQRIGDRSEIDIKNRYFGILEPLKKKAMNSAKQIMSKKRQT